MNANTKVLLVIMSFILVSSSCFQLNQFPILKTLMSILSKCAFIISLFYSVIFYRKPVNKFLLLILLFFVILVYLSNINSFSYIELVPIFMKLIGVLLFFTPHIIRHNKDSVIILSNVFSTIVFLNFIQMIIMPNLMGYGYLIASNYNQFGSIVIITIVLSYLKYKYTQKKIGYFFILLISLATVAIPGSLTSTLSLFVLEFFLLSNGSVKWKKSMIRIVIIFTIVFIVLFVIGQNVIYYNPFIRDLVTSLGKDVTLSGRTYIWLYTMLTISYSPIIGWGYYDKDWALVNLNGINSHNIILNLLVQGGIVLLFVFVIILMYIFHRLNSCENLNIKLTLYFSSSIFFLMCQLEVYNYFMLFMFIYILCIGSCCNNLKCKR